MKSWKQLIIRHGFMVELVRPNVFYCLRDTEGNVEFLIESLEKNLMSFMLEKNKKGCRKLIRQLIPFI